jgi:hypothetical protein
MENVKLLADKTKCPAAPDEQGQGLVSFLWLVVK